MFMCFVLGLNLGVFANSKALLLSSKTLQFISGRHISIGTPLSCNSVINPIKGMVWCSPSLKAINSASVVLKATSVCNFEAQDMGHPANVITNPALDLVVNESTWAVAGYQFPLKSASHHKSNDCALGL